MTGQEKTETFLRALVIADCEDDALLLKREMIKGGYKPIVTRVNCPGAMSVALRNQTWDLVLAYWSLPRFSALFALEMLKCNGLDIPFIVVSETIGEEAAIVAMNAGVHDYVMKSNLGRLTFAIKRELCEADDRRSRKRAEAAFVTGEERLKLVAPVTNDAIWDWDMTTQTIGWSEGFQDLSGFRLYEVPPGVEFWFSRLHPDEKERVVMTRYAAINGGREMWSDHYRFCRADGAYAYVLDRGHLLRNEEGLVVRAVGALIDLTEQKRAEADIAAAYERLRDLTLRMERTKEEDRYGSRGNYMRVCPATDGIEVGSGLGGQTARERSGHVPVNWFARSPPPATKHPR
jgi:PAS domain S-box-containing protein